MGILIKRNIKLFFRDKGMFFTSLITPAILLVLYATFLGNVYKDGFTSSLPEGVKMSEKLLGGLVGGQLISSILAVSCVTVSFCSNMLMVQDKANGTIKDFTVAPVKGSVLALSYYFASIVSSLVICFAGMVVCLLYVAYLGWYMSASDVALLSLDVFMLVLFGTALSSVINYFLSTQGQISAVGSIVSSCYGFICGAYMPISQFSPVIQKIVSCLPGTYGTALVRTHSMRGVFAELEKEGFPSEYVEITREVVDCKLYFFDNAVSVGTMYAVIITTIAALVTSYAFMNVKKKKDR